MMRAAGWISSKTRGRSSMAVGSARTRGGFSRARRRAGAEEAAPVGVRRGFRAGGERCGGGVGQHQPAALALDQQLVPVNGFQDLRGPLAQGLQEGIESQFHAWFLPGGGRKGGRLL